MNKALTEKKIGLGLVLLLAVIPLSLWSCGKKALPTTVANDTASTSIKAATVSGSAVTATAGGAWVNTSFTNQTSDFTVNFTASVSTAPTNAIIALGNGAQTAYASFAALVRFNTSGDIDAYDGAAAGYIGPSTPVAYSAGTAYAFVLTVHPKTQTYDAIVNGRVIGTGLKFRASATSLNDYGAFVSTSGGSGSLTVSGFSILTPTPTSTPSFTATPTWTSVSTGLTANAGGAWANASFANQTGDFSISFDASISAAPNNAVVALSNGAKTAYTSFSNLVRFNASGDIDAYNGTVGGYAGPSTAIHYSANTVYSFLLTIHMAAQTYDIAVKQGTGSYQTIGTGFKFRAAVTSLNNYGAYIGTGGSGSLTVQNLTLGSAPTPTVTNTFTNTYTATNSPTITNTFTSTWTGTATNTYTITNTPTWTNTPTNTFTKTATPTFTHTPVPPTATPTSSGLNINFSQWYLQEPSGSGTSPTTRSNTWLEAGNSDAYFYRASDGWQAYMDTKTGITTSGSKHPRCEMHEESTWGASGTNTLTVAGKVTLIDGDTTTVGQIFNNNEGTLVELQYSKSLGGFKVFYEEVKGSGGYPTQTTAYVPMNTAYTYQLALTGGVAKVTINGQQVFSKTLSSTVSGSQFYFKAGNYDQSAVAGSVSTTPYSIVEIGSAVIVHK